MVKKHSERVLLSMREGLGISSALVFLAITYAMLYRVPGVSGLVPCGYR